MLSSRAKLGPNSGTRTPPQKVAGHVCPPVWGKDHSLYPAVFLPALPANKDVKAVTNDINV